MKRKFSEPGFEELPPPRPAWQGRMRRPQERTPPLAEDDVGIRMPVGSTRDPGIRTLVKLPAFGVLLKLSTMTGGVIDDLSWFQGKKTVVAGGAALTLWEHGHGHPESDVDLWIVDPCEHAAYVDGCCIRRSATELERLLRKFPAGSIFTWSKTAVTVHVPDVRRTFQVVFSCNATKAEILNSFDLPMCKVAFDGTDLWCTEACFRAVTCRAVRVAKRWETGDWHVSEHSLVPGETTRVDVSRMVRYRLRGFEILASSESEQRQLESELVSANEKRNRCLGFVHDVQGYPSLGELSRQKLRDRFIPSRKEASRWFRFASATADAGSAGAAATDSAKAAAAARRRLLAEAAMLAMGHERSALDVDSCLRDLYYQPVVLDSGASYEDPPLDPRIGAVVPSVDPRLFKQDHGAHAAVRTAIGVESLVLLVCSYLNQFTIHPHTVVTGPDRITILPRFHCPPFFRTGTREFMISEGREHGVDDYRRNTVRLKVSRPGDPRLPSIAGWTERIRGDLREYLDQVVGSGLIRVTDNCPSVCDVAARGPSPGEDGYGHSGADRPPAPEDSESKSRNDNEFVHVRTDGISPKFISEATAPGVYVRCDLVLCSIVVNICGAHFVFKLVSPAIAGV